MEVREQFVGISCRLPSCGFCGSNSGHQVWQQAPLPTKPSLPTHNVHSLFIHNNGFIMTFSHIYAMHFNPVYRLLLPCPCPTPHNLHLSEFFHFYFHVFKKLIIIFGGPMSSCLQEHGGVDLWGCSHLTSGYTIEEHLPLSPPAMTNIISIQTEG